MPILPNNGCWCPPSYSWGLIYKISYDNLTIIWKFRLTCDGRLIYKTSYEERKVFLSTIRSQNRKIVWDSVRALAYDIPERNFSTL